jgi:hypothetical protein
MNNKSKEQLRTSWKTIVGTVGSCVAIFAFLYTYTLNIKNAQIELLKTQGELLKAQLSVMKDKIMEMEVENCAKNKDSIARIVKQPNDNTLADMTKDFKLSKKES